MPSRIELYAGCAGKAPMTSPPDRTRVVLKYLGLSAVLHLAWETVHLPLYTIWSAPLGERVFAVIHCTGGDVLIAASTLGLAIVLVGRNWPENARARRHVAIVAHLVWRRLHGVQRVAQCACPAELGLCALNAAATAFWNRAYARPSVAAVAGNRSEPRHQRSACQREQVRRPITLAYPFCTAALQARRIPNVVAITPS